MKLTCLHCNKDFETTLTENYREIATWDHHDVIWCPYCSKLTMVVKSINRFNRINGIFEKEIDKFLAEGVA